MIIVKERLSEDDKGELRNLGGRIRSIVPVEEYLSYIGLANKGRFSDIPEVYYSPSANIPRFREYFRFDHGSSRKKREETG
jgi:hypothetical protein